MFMKRFRCLVLLLQSLLKHVGTFVAWLVSCHPYHISSLSLDLFNEIPYLLVGGGFGKHMLFFFISLGNSIVFFFKNPIFYSEIWGTDSDRQKKAGSSFLTWKSLISGSRESKQASRIGF